jgi:Tfp pilus assembly protein PilO
MAEIDRVIQEEGAARQRNLARWDVAYRVFLVTAIVTAVLGLGAAIYMADQYSRDECRQRGGRIMEVHGSRDRSWVCWEP